MTGGACERSRLHRLRTDEGHNEDGGREALEAPRSRRYFNTKHGRMNVRHQLRVSGRTIVVSYEECAGRIVVVNTVREKG